MQKYVPCSHNVIAVVALRILAVESLLAMLCGCATTRFYPLCVIDSFDISVEQLWLRSKPFVEDAIYKTVIGKSENTVINITGAVVIAYEFEHKNIEAIWPSIACIGSSLSGAADILLRQCQQDMLRYFNEEWSVWPGEINQASSVCVRFQPPLHGKARTVMSARQ